MCANAFVVIHFLVLETQNHWYRLIFVCVLCFLPPYERIINIGRKHVNWRIHLWPPCVRDRNLLIHVDIWVLCFLPPYERIIDRESRHLQCYTYWSIYLRPVIRVINSKTLKFSWLIDWIHNPSLNPELNSNEKLFTIWYLFKFLV